MKPEVQISIDVTTIEEALDIAEVAVGAGVDWLEAGTPLILGEGMHAVSALKERFPETPVVADLKIMDGGYLETEMAAKAGADMVVVMDRAPLASVRACVRAGREFGCQVMGDILLGSGPTAHDPVSNARVLEAEGVDMIGLHTSYDSRHEEPMDPMEYVAAMVAAVSVPVQVVGGLSIEQMVECVRLGAPYVVVGAPLVVADERFAAADELSQLGLVLREVVARVRDAS
jgi:3-hexulose-6-phosphate synthase/6-phospho-3-hexuloisomerase